MKDTKDSVGINNRYHELDKKAKYNIELFKINIYLKYSQCLRYEV